jgi:RNA polymerase sigma factor for flagellar operon FliA
MGAGDDRQAPAVTPEDHLVKAELEWAVRTHVTGLPKLERALIERTYFQGQKIDEAAASMGVTRSWARRVHDRAIERIEGGLRKRGAIADGGSRCRQRRS